MAFVRLLLNCIVIVKMLIQKLREIAFGYKAIVAKFPTKMS